MQQPSLARAAQVHTGTPWGTLFALSRSLDVSLQRHPDQQIFSANLMYKTKWLTAFVLPFALRRLSPYVSHRTERRGAAQAQATGVRTESVTFYVLRSALPTSTIIARPFTHTTRKGLRAVCPNVPPLDSYSPSKLMSSNQIRSGDGSRTVACRCPCPESCIVRILLPRKYMCQHWLTCLSP